MPGATMRTAVPEAVVLGTLLIQTSSLGHVSQWSQYRRGHAGVTARMTLLQQLCLLLSCIATNFCPCSSL